MGGAGLEQVGHRAIQITRSNFSRPLAVGFAAKRGSAASGGEGCMNLKIRVIGAGLAGSEAAWQIARRGLEVELFEMRPLRSTPAHQTGDFAELVCSNSLKSDSENTAPWLLKEEMRRAGSLLLSIARECAVPAGRALAVDRVEFADRATEEYGRFYDSLMSAHSVEEQDWENLNYFESCLPIEEIARRGRDTLRFGPMKPVGLKDPRTGKMPFAVVQLRQENLRADSYNLVGFQNHLKFGEQARVLRLIPGLENARFLRYGQIHRNTYINGPTLLSESLQMKQHPRILFAGQICGVE